MRKFTIFILLLSAATGALAQGGFAVTVETTEVRATSIEASVTTVGTIIAEASATLRTEVPGQIVGIHFKEGQRVARGERMFSVEATVLEAEVNEARANAERSEAAYTRAKELFAKQLISATDYDAARANYDVDKARLRSSLARLSKTVIRAPFDGFAGLRRINIGDYATIGQELVDLVKLDPLRVEFSVPETLLPKVQPDLPVGVLVDAYPGETFRGTITAVSPQSEVQGHNLRVRANLPNADLKLRPGLFVQVEVSLGTRDNAIVIPEEAIWPVGQNKTVFVVEEGKALQRIVTTGERQPGAVEIVSGLDPGEVIVTAGQMKLYDGAAVNAVDSGATGANGTAEARP